MQVQEFHSHPVRQIFQEALWDACEPVELVLNLAKLSRKSDTGMKGVPNIAFMVAQQLSGGGMIVVQVDRLKII
jgi:hypothetical protein